MNRTVAGSQWRSTLYRETIESIEKGTRTYSCGCAEGPESDSIRLCSYHEGMEYGIEVGTGKP
jgi:hypothetical protein